MTDIYPLISIVTLNYNQSELTFRLLKSLENCSYPNFEVIVCDMASQSDQTDILSTKNFSHATMQYSAVNRGFAGGNNWGVQFCKGEYVLFLNNDTEVEPDLLLKLSDAFKKSSSIGVVSPKIMRYDQQDMIEYAGFDKMNFYTGQVHSRGYYKIDSPIFHTEGNTHCAHGCAMMMRRSTFLENGGFCDDYFLYYEEWDFCTRLVRKGYKIWYEPSGVVYHKESQSLGKSNPLKLYYLTRNRILFIRRHSAFHQRIIFYLYMAVVSIPYHVIKFTLKRQQDAMRSFLDAVKWNVVNKSTPHCDMYTNL